MLRNRLNIEKMFRKRKSIATGVDTRKSYSKYSGRVETSKNSNAASRVHSDKKRVHVIFGDALFEKVLTSTQVLEPYIVAICEIANHLFIKYAQPCLDMVFLENEEESNIDPVLVLSCDIALGIFLILFSRDYILCVAAFEAFRLGESYLETFTIHASHQSETRKEKGRCQSCKCCDVALLKSFNNY